MLVGLGRCRGRGMQSDCIIFALWLKTAYVQVNYDQTVLNNLCTLVSPLVVTDNGYDNRKYKLDFMTRFIVHFNETRTLICVHKSVVKNREWKTLFVHFSDGAIERAQLFLKQAPTDYTAVFLSVPSPSVMCCYKRECGDYI